MTSPPPRRGNVRRVVLPLQGSVPWGGRVRLENVPQVGGDMVRLVLPDETARLVTVRGIEADGVQLFVGKGAVPGVAFAPNGFPVNMHGFVKAGGRLVLELEAVPRPGKVPNILERAAARVLGRWFVPREPLRFLEAVPVYATAFLDVLEPDAEPPPKKARSRKPKQPKGAPS